jgi:hypothetical protein
MNSILVIFVFSSVAIIGSSAQCVGTGVYCPSSDDCNTMYESCSGRDRFATTLACPTGRYCRVSNITTLAGSCVTDVANTCSASTDFQCSSIGIFPNPSDCTSYYKCSENEAGDSWDAELKRCYTGYVFSPFYSGYCAPRVGNLNCFTLTCPTALTTTQYIKFGNTLRYYGICAPFLAAPLMGACPEGSIFKTEADNFCEFVCPGFGNFPNSEDERKFFTCIIVPGVGYKATEDICGIREVYNRSTRNCQVKL